MKEQTMGFTFRGFEMHGWRMWQRARIEQALAFIRAHGMTALVLHEPDIMHQLVFPRAFFDPYAQWKGAPTRRGENAIHNNRAYFEHVMYLAANQGTELWLEVKELAFPDEVLQARPELVKAGVVCPSEPFWRDFIAAKTDELLADFPLLSGIILSPGSPEGRASRAQNKCGCAVCAATSVVDWYDGIIRAMHAPLAARGKRLAVRDFAYKPVDHEPLIAAVGRQPADVIFCIKTTPHDFYPTFPDNPAFGRLSDRPQWVEYDVQGQFYGWGVFPCAMFDDIRRRLAHAAGKGASGGLFRSEWERINDLSAADGANAVNMVAAAMLALGPASDAAIAAAWLSERGWDEGAAPWLAGVAARTWPILRDALYIDDFLFSDASMFPRSIGRAWWTMESKHALVPWSPGHAGRLELDAARIDELMAQKRSALDGARALVEFLGRPQEGVPAELLALWRQSTELLPRYAEGMLLCAEVCLRARWQDRAPEQADRAAFAAAVERLAQFGEALRPLASAARHPHQVVMLLDAHRVEDIVAEARRMLG
jgi:hypothetical protein